METKQQVKQKERPAHAEQEKRQRFPIHFAPEQNGGDDHRDQKNGIEEEKLGGEKIENLRMPAFANSAVVGNMLQRDPMVLGVPHQDRYRAQEIDEQRK